MASSKLSHNAAKSSVPDHDPDDRSIFQIRRRRAYKYRPSSSSVRAVSGGIFSATDLKDLKLSRRCGCFRSTKTILSIIQQQVIASRMEQPHYTTTTASTVFLGQALAGLALDALYHGNESTGSLMVVSKNR